MGLINMIQGTNISHNKSLDTAFHDLALHIFSNCSHIMTKACKLESCVESQTWITLDLIPILIEELKEAHNTPNEAAVAMNCLNNLIAASGDVRAVVECDSITTVLNEAKRIGEGSHASLKAEYGI